MSAAEAAAGGHAWARRPWRARSVRFAVALAFADASIVVLALPQIVQQLDTTIERSTWVIMAYNVALIAVVVAYLAAGRRIHSRPALLAGLALFGLASLGCGVAGSLELLVAMRCVQGAGGALLLCASLPLLAGAGRPGESSMASWAAAAAIGAAVGPAAGGLLTELFDWRAIFIAQTPAAALAIAAVLAVPAASFREVVDEPHDRSEIGPATANVGLLLLSAGLIGALFLIVVLLINVWLLSPAAAAAVVSAIPIATILVERAARGRSPTLVGGAGAILLAAGLGLMALIDERQIPVAVAGLALCGAGLGLAFTTLTASAMSGGGTAMARAGRTVAAREAGLVLGLLVLTPIFVDDLGEAAGRALPPVTVALFTAPIPEETRDGLIPDLLAAYGNTPEASLPDLNPAFDEARADADPAARSEISALQGRIEAEVERAVTRSFRDSLLYSAAFALLVLTPIFVDDLGEAAGRALPPVTVALFTAPIPEETRDGLIPDLLAAYGNTPEASLPDLNPAFDEARADADPAARSEISALQGRIEAEVERAVTRSFRDSLLYSAAFALLVLPALVVGLVLARRSRPPTAVEVTTERS